MICFCLLSSFFGLSSRSSCIDTLTTFQAKYYLESTTVTASSSSRLSTRKSSKSKLFLLSTKKGQDEEYHHQETWNPHVSDAYNYAKFIRTVYGKERAIPFYRDILLHLNPNDFSAASRIAATSTNNITSSFGPLVEGITTTVRQRQDIRSFADVLRSSNYTASMVNTIFDAPITYNEQCTATGPIYAKPVTSTYPTKPCPFTFEQTSATTTDSTDTANQKEHRTTIKNKEEKEANVEESKKCLIALFILGFAMPRNILVSSIVGANETVNLMERLGLIYPCTIDSTLLVPAVSIFPIDINTNGSKVQKQVLSLYFVTDWHPAVLLSTTAAGTKGEEEGTVMYIGPDSLALVANWPLVLSQFPFFKQQQLQFSDDGTNNATKASSLGNHTMDVPRCIKILDLCCGSGIQALSYLSILKYLLPTTEQKIKATCVDINPRALRFTRFNAILNDLDDAVDTLEENILDWEGIIMRSKYNDDENFHNNNKQNITTTMELSLANCNQLLKSAPYNIILANPPFIPVPPPQTESNTEGTKIDDANCLNNSNNNSSLLVSTISRRYGLFSSGGASGEDILQSIVRVAPHLLAQTNVTNSVVAIVSEFMNPDCTLLERISDWWMFHQLNNNNTPKHTDSFKGFSSSHGDATSSSDAAYTDTGVVCTNQFPLSADLYASRRAADHDGVEKQRWSKHLEQMGINFISPGLLFIYRKANTARDDDENNTAEETKKRKSSINTAQLQSHHIILPKSRLGSIWTPHNYEAVEFTAEKIQDLLHSLKTF
jgi:methylase of polypeptide subunit release factors